MKNWFARFATASSKIRPGHHKKAPRFSGRFTRHLRMETLEDRKMLSIMVNTLTDEDDGINVGGVSLRDAINAAAPSGDTINFDPNVSGINGGTITLAHGEIPFSKPLTIDATMLSLGITIDADDLTPWGSPNEAFGDGIRIFNIIDTSTNHTDPPLVTLKGLTLTGGDPNQDDGLYGFGGAIRSEAMLVLDDCTITDNLGFAGGGVWMNVAGGDPSTPREILRIEGSTIENNHAFNGAGIKVISGTSGSPTADSINVLSASMISGNTLAGTGNGGGIYAQLVGAELTIADSSVTGNHAFHGGGIYASIAGNGTSPETLMTISNSHVESNSSDYNGGGVVVLFNSAESTGTMFESIIPFFRKINVPTEVARYISRAVPMGMMPLISFRRFSSIITQQLATAVRSTRTVSRESTYRLHRVAQSAATTLRHIRAEEFSPVLITTHISLSLSRQSLVIRAARAVECM